MYPVFSISHNQDRPEYSVMPASSMASISKVLPA